MSTTYTDPEEMILASWNGSTLTQKRYKLREPISVTAVDRFPGKITIGDYTKDSNDLLSSWAISDLTGGHGIADHQAGVTDNRYRFGTIYTRYPSQWSKPYDIELETLSVDEVYPLGDLVYSGTWYRMILANDTLYQDTTSRGACTGPPTDKSVTYTGTNTQPILYVPKGNNGYSAFDPSGPTLRNVSASEKVQSFLVWDEKLLAMQNNGKIAYATAGTAGADTTFTNYQLGGVDLKLDAQYEPKKLHAFWNRQGEETPFLVTDQNVWAFDPEVPRFYRVPDFESVHPYFGVASQVWKGELYVAAGMDILAFNGEVIRNVGLSRDDGLPYQYQGYVRDFAAGQNALYAYVRGATISGTTYWSVHEWSGFGWHCIKTGSSSGYLPTRMAISRAGSTYRLYWGGDDGGTLYYQNLPREFTNPRESIAEYQYATLMMGDFTNETTVGGFDYYTTTYYLETGRNDFGMKGYRKVANAVEIDIPTGAGSGETLTIKYRIDSDTSWTTLGSTASASYHNIFQFGTVDPTTGLYPGLGFESIEFRIEITDHLEQPYIYASSMSIESIVFSFLKIMHPSESYSAVLDLTAEYQDVNSTNALDFLKDQRQADAFTFMKYQGTWKRVRIAQMSEPEMSGMDPRVTICRVALVEVPTTLGLPES